MTPRSLRRAMLAAAIALGLLALAPAIAPAAPIDSLGGQLRLTQVGPDGNPSFDTATPTVAYNSRRDEYLVAWSGTDPALPNEVEIYGRLLDGRGRPKGAARRLTQALGTSPASAPVLGYSPAIDQYLLAYTAQVTTPDVQREVFGQSITAAGTPVGDERRISTTGLDNGVGNNATDPALAHDAERDQFRLVWSADDIATSDFEIQTQRVNSSLQDVDAELESTVSATSAGDARSPAIAFLPGADRYVVTWEADKSLLETEIFAKALTISGAQAVLQRQISFAGTRSARSPDVAANPGADQALVSFVKNDVSDEGPEVFTQRLSSGLTLLGENRRISAIGPAGSTSLGANAFAPTNVAFHPVLKSFLVTWAGDDDVRGLVDGEIERWGQALDAAGAPIGADDFRISTAGPDGSTAAQVVGGALVPRAGRREWLHVWSADDPRPPLADDELETYGRLIGDDRDLDGAVTPADCDDANAAVRPGATEIRDDGIDQDCSGADLENLDRDGDGVNRPADCDDGNRFVAPGAADAPGDGIDQDCSGADAVPPPPPPAPPAPPQLTTAGIDRFFSVFARFTRVDTLAVLRVKPGMTVSVSCKGPGCPRALRRTRTLPVRRAGKLDLRRFFKRAKVRPRARIEIRIVEPGAIGRVDRFRVRNGKVPVRTQRCLAPGASAPGACPA